MSSLNDLRDAELAKILRAVDKSNPVEMHICSLGSPIPYFDKCLKEYREGNNQRGINDVYYDAPGTLDLDEALKNDPKLNVIFINLHPSQHVEFLELYADVIAERNIMVALCRKPQQHKDNPLPKALEVKIGKIVPLQLLEFTSDATIFAVAP